MPAIASAFDQIQGNIVGGFNKDFQDFLFLRFKSAASGRAWIAEISGTDAEGGLANSTSAKVLKYNNEFKALRRQGLDPEVLMPTAWNNLALTFQGLKALGMADDALKAFPDDFRQGMAARKAQIGDLGPSDPSRWLAPFADPSKVHAVLIVAADNKDLLDARLAALNTPAFVAGAEVIGDPVHGPVHGRAREGAERGHEHFGFKDGVSQPGLRGVDLPDDPVGNPDQGHPGQDLLWPGEFVLGYPTQIPKAKPGFDGPNPDAGAVSTSGPAWTVNGSYLVFRRLDQDVPGFNLQIDALADRLGMAPDLVGAKLVGRYKSGCPLETRTFERPGLQQPLDPGVDAPALAESDTLNLNFEFGGDADGDVVPLASHIRKAYPRDEDTGEGDDSESATQTHRLLRRGIAFGASIGEPSGGGKADRRGLLFLCYQRSIRDQFEFVQHSWVNDPAFPPKPAGRPTPGQDPIIAQSAEGGFQFGRKGASVAAKHFVTTSGGEYFFQPSIAALQQIGAGAVGK